KDRPLVLPHNEIFATNADGDAIAGDSTSHKGKSGGKRNKANTREKDGTAMECFKIAIGRNDEVTPREIVGAIANEAGIEGQYMGQIRIQDTHSFVDLPKGMPNDVLQTLKRVRIKQKPLNIEKYGDSPNKTYKRAAKSSGAKNEGQGKSGQDKTPQSNK